MIDTVKLQQESPFIITNPLPLIPAYITVHLGPPDSSSQIVTVPFPDYIKNVASSELYPTWPESALIANIHCQVSVALNRIYTEWYRSRGYNFDITNSTSVDQAFVYGREIYDNIDDLVNRIYNQYVARAGFFEPLYAQFCDGIQTQCRGLSQWGSVDLAENGYGPMQIIHHYFGDDVVLIAAAQTDAILESYPGYPLSLGSVGSHVIELQVMLNRIAVNYPSIPQIPLVGGTFDEVTKEAVMQFQRIFDLAVDGIVGRATWNKVFYIYTAVKRLGEITSEGIEIAEARRAIKAPLSPGSTFPFLRLIQYYLVVISQFYPTVPLVPITGYYCPVTESAVSAFQEIKGLEVTGTINRATWDVLYDSVIGIFQTIPISEIYFPRLPYPGYPLYLGTEGPDVLTIQQYLNFISTQVPSIPSLTPDGIFGEKTKEAVIAFEKAFGLPPDGFVAPETWDLILDVYANFRYGQPRSETQYPGFVLLSGLEDYVPGTEIAQQRPAEQAT